MTIARTHRLVSLALFTLACVVLGPNPASAQNDGDLKKPGSWAEFTAYLIDGGDLGWWETSGVTTDVWKTIPAGIPYHYRARTSLDEAGRQVVRTFTYVDDQGKLLSAGSETIAWDDKSGVPAKSLSGLDAGRPWSASGKLVGFDDSKTVFSSEESGGGETYELLTTIERLGENRRRRTVARADGKETPFIQQFTRVNHFVEALSGWDPTGNWVTDMGGMAFVNEARWSADKRCVVTIEGIRMSDGSVNVTGNGLMWFDIHARVIRQKYITSTGMMLEGEVSSASKNLLKMRYVGIDAEGVALDARITTERKGDQLISTFSDMIYDGRASTPAWAREPMVATREQKK